MKRSKQIKALRWEIRSLLIGMFVTLSWANETKDEPTHQMFLKMCDANKKQVAACNEQIQQLRESVWWRRLIRWCFKN